MDKELEALERLAMPDEMHIEECKKLGIDPTEDYDFLKQALLELKAIKEANPSEALKYLENMIDTLLVENKNKIEVSKANNYDCELLEERRKDLKSYKQSLIKTQEQEKVLKLIKEKDVDIYLLTNADNLEEYNSKMNWSYRRLIQEEFALLKKWPEGE